MLTLGKGDDCNNISKLFLATLKSKEEELRLAIGVNTDEDPALAVREPEVTPEGKFKDAVVSVACPLLQYCDVWNLSAL